MLRIINWCTSLFKPTAVYTQTCFNEPADCSNPVSKTDLDEPIGFNQPSVWKPFKDYKNILEEVDFNPEDFFFTDDCKSCVNTTDDCTSSVVKPLEDDFNPEDFFFKDIPQPSFKPAVSRKRTRAERDCEEEEEDDEPELTGLSKKGTPYKSKAFVYGMAGERYVGKHIKCQRCGKALHQLRANFPGVDFKCKHDHYVQLKATKKMAKRDGQMSLMCGQYEMQRDALKRPMGADFMILNYSGKRVKRIKYLRNENIDLDDLTPRNKDQRVVKDKQVVGFKNFKASSLKVDCSLLENIKIPDDCDELPLNVQFRKTIRRLLDENPNLPLPEYQIESFRNSVELSRPVYYTVNLERMTCTCPSFFHKGHKPGFQCKHIVLACLRHFKQNILSIRVADVRNGNLKRTVFYTVNLHEKTCNCSSFTLNKTCHHVDRYCN